MMKKRFACASLVLALFFSGSATQAFAADKDRHHPDPCKDHPAKCKNLPEAPIPLGLPLAGIVVAGGYVLLVRRHGQPAKPTAMA